MVLRKWGWGAGFAGQGFSGWCWGGRGDGGSEGANGLEGLMRVRLKKINNRVRPPAAGIGWLARLLEELGVVALG